MCDELGGMWKETAMAYFKVPCQHMSGSTEESHEVPRQDNQTPGQSLWIQNYFLVFTVFLI